MKNETFKKKIVRYFDKLEDEVRARLSHRSIIYAFIGGAATVLFWRGVWHTADLFFYRFFPDLEGPLSLLIGAVMLLLTGLFVSEFIGERIIISGLKGEKKITEKTESEVREETNILEDIHHELKHIHELLEEIKK